MQVKMGVDNMVRMVKITATPAVVQEMRNTGRKNMKKICSY